MLTTSYTHAWLLGMGLVSLAGLAIIAAHNSSRMLQSPTCVGQHLPQEDTDEDSEGEIEIPDEFKDPISLGIIEDPVVLCATGQVYCLTTLRQWFKMGNRICPRTNTTVLDAQVTRLPWLKQRLHEWRLKNGLEIPSSSDDDTKAKLETLHPSLTAWINDIRTDSDVKRTKAMSQLYALLRSWDAEPTAEHAKAHQLVREAVLNDLVWLLRYGDSYLQGVAASVLASCDTAEEVQWLAAVAVAPSVLICLSPSTYTSQAATRLLYNLARAGNAARTAIKIAGGHNSLLKVVSTDRAEYGYSRDRAAATLAVLARDPEIQAQLKQRALKPLRTMFLTSEDRWEKRDSATALLKLFNQDEMGEDLTIKELFEHWWCSRAWLEGKVEQPSEGYSEEEMVARRDIAFWQENASEYIDQLMARDMDLHVHVAVVEEEGPAVEHGAQPAA